MDKQEKSQINAHFSLKLVTRSRAREVLGEQEVPHWLHPSNDRQGEDCWLARPTSMAAYFFMQNEEAFWSAFTWDRPISRGQWMAVCNSRGEVLFAPEHLNFFIGGLGNADFDPWKILSSKESEVIMEKKRFRIVRRHYHDSLEDQIIATGLTMEEAKAHCKDKETSSQTATSPEALAYTAEYGSWYDGYAEEQESENDLPGR